MKITISNCDFIDVTCEGTYTGNNGDTYTFTITTPGGQSCLLNGEEVEEFSFAIVGNAELAEFFKAIENISGARF